MTDEQKKSGFAEAVEKVVAAVGIVPGLTDILKDAVPEIVKSVSAVRVEVAAARQERQAAVVQFIQRLVDAGTPSDVIIEALREEYGRTTANTLAGLVTEIMGRFRAGDGPADANEEG